MFNKHSTMTDKILILTLIYVIDNFDMIISILSFPRSQILATFTIPSMAKRWTKLGIKVETDKISLYLNCQLHERVFKTRQVQSLEIESGSHLYLGSAGESFKDTPNYYVSILFLISPCSFYVEFSPSPVGTTFIFGFLHFMFIRYCTHHPFI